jgi:hypothetical protein
MEHRSPTRKHFTTDSVLANPPLTETGPCHSGKVGSPLTQTSLPARSRDADLFDNPTAGSSFFPLPAVTAPTLDTRTFTRPRSRAIPFAVCADSKRRGGAPGRLRWQGIQRPQLRFVSTTMVNSQPPPATSSSDLFVSLRAFSCLLDPGRAVLQAGQGFVQRQRLSARDGRRFLLADS